ncbi:MAG: type I-MYXAN CRISPR-associated protein Cas6/Cmx6 [Pirellulaceae bacterium]
MHIDLSFRLIGQSTIPSDHGYHLYAAVSRVSSQAHEPNGIGVHPIRGRQIGDRQIQLTDFSRLTIRTEADHISRWLPLAGKQLNVGGRPIRVGVPEVRSLTPTVALRSRLVTIKVSSVRGESPAPPDAESFRAAALRQLASLGISDAASLTLGKRRTLRIKDKEVVGYEVLVSELTVEDSLVLQERGLGGRRHMGCGIFVPVNKREEA